MIVPAQSVGKVLPKEIKEKIIKQEYTVYELNDIYKILLSSEKNNNQNFIANAIIFFIVFAWFGYKAITITNNIIFGILFGLAFYLPLLIFFFWFQRLAKKQFLKLIKKYYKNDYDKIINVNVIDNQYYGGFIISKNITRNGIEPKLVVRNNSHLKECNGWIIYSANDNQEFMANPNNFEIVSAQTISKFVPELLNIFNSPYGTNLTINYINGKFAGFVNTKKDNIN